ncbi:MAG TPA: tRNA pseudouridine(55) synthase TruB [candidate division CPR3 bacterium]|uniref:tRNA pseudouridine synthase B n=1 Tax=candidate division CPR3 bacterium TaxID=2268181 RepID=A0A7C1NMJ6_UNCC3|nr:tRNA pseudouridine(55) synthase TruB [candidate division CPR3 bacterium]
MLLNINKPKGITSHDVVDEVRRITGEKRVGHAGTLDPFATGVLVVGVGRETTKLLGAISKESDKEYEATIELGKESDTGDPEGNIIDTGTLRDITKKELLKVLKEFTGTIQQTPPQYSAIKVKGTPAYKRKRRGEEFTLSPRDVVVSDITILKFQPPIIKLKITCSAGTYIRVLAQDIGKKLKTGAYLKELTRTRVGEYVISDSITLKDLLDRKQQSN